MRKSKELPISPSRGDLILLVGALPRLPQSVEAVMADDLESPFFLPREVDEISRLSDVTRWRREKAGRFPRRVKLSARKVAYRKSEIEDWRRDPEGWAKRNAIAGA